MNLKAVQLALFSAIFLCCTSVAMADDVCPTSVQGGQTVTWNDYLNAATSSYFGGFSTCHIGNLDFSGFGYSSSGNPPGPADTLPAGSINVFTITTPLDEGFNFDPLALSAGNGVYNEDANISFTVTDTAGTLIDDLSQYFNGSVSGTGSATFSENYCLTPPNQNCSSLPLLSYPNNSQSITFSSPVASISVDKDFQVNSGPSGNASISQANNQFSQLGSVPEPRMVSVLALALIAGLAFFKKQHAARS